MSPDSQEICQMEEKSCKEIQNRRQFLNGLGKWSMALIAAVTVLRDGLKDIESVIGWRFEPSQRIAKHADQPHKDYPHGDWTTPHLDYWRKVQPSEAERAPGGTRRPPGATPGGTEMEKP